MATKEIVGFSLGFIGMGMMYIGGLVYGHRGQYDLMAACYAATNIIFTSIAVSVVRSHLLRAIEKQ